MVDTDDIERIARCVVGYVWSPIHFKDGHRRQANYIAANWCALDFESPEILLEDAQRIFCDRVHVIGTTRNHRINKGGVVLDRFRVLLKWERPIDDLRVYRWNMRQMTERYPCDAACRDGARFFFPCQAITQQEAEGYLEEVSTEVPEWFDAALVPSFGADRKEDGTMPGWVAWALDRIIPHGERNRTVYRIAMDLTKYGMDEERVVRLIVAGKTYNGQAEPNVMADIRKAVRNGAKKAREDGYGR